MKRCLVICALLMSHQPCFTAGDFSTSSGGRAVKFFEISPSSTLAAAHQRCELEGLTHFVPRSAPDANKILDTLDSNAGHGATYHGATWIMSETPTPPNSQWGGHSTNARGGGQYVPDAGPTKLSAIRKNPSSFCNPQDYDSALCWDTGPTAAFVACEPPAAAVTTTSVTTATATTATTTYLPAPGRERMSSEDWST